MTLERCSPSILGLEVVGPQIWNGIGESWGLREILFSYPVIYRNRSMRWECFPKWWLLRNRKICLYSNKNSMELFLQSCHVRIGGATPAGTSSTCIVWCIHASW